MSKLLLLWFSLTVVSATLYATSGSMGRASKLYEINAATGRGTFIGSITVNSRPVSINGLAFDRTNRELGGQMYAHTSPLSPFFPNSLITLDVANGIGELVGQSELPGMADLAIDEFGTIYGMNRGTNPYVRIDDLAKFDLSNGRARLFGDSGLSLGSYGMDFDRDNNNILHLVNFFNGTGTYSTLSAANGKATAVRTITNAAFACGFGTINPDGFTIGNEYWCPEVADDGGVNINSRIQVVWLPFATTMTTIQTQVTDLTTLAFTFETTESPSTFPSQQPTGKPSQSPSLRPSGSPSASPTEFPSSLPSVKPSYQPSRSPSSSPSAKPSNSPSISPTDLASSGPSALPSTSPTTGQPSTSPSERPSLLPSSKPSLRPSRGPSQNPTVFGSAVPTVSLAPSNRPSPNPSSSPTIPPSALPSEVPSASPSAKPSAQPIIMASQHPSRIPSAVPTGLPTSTPSGQPTLVPSTPPTIAPTIDPCTTNECTILFVIPGRWVRSDWFGQCIERCAVLAGFELSLGAQCGRCP